MKRKSLSMALMAILIHCPLSAADSPGDGDKGNIVRKDQAGKLSNLPARNEEFMDWGLGMSVHWSLDSHTVVVRLENVEFVNQ